MQNFIKNVQKDLYKTYKKLYNEQRGRNEQNG